MSVDAPKPIEMPAIDYAEHTVEVDTRWLIKRAQAHAKSMDIDSKTTSSNVTVELDPEQVAALLMATK